MGAIGYIVASITMAAIVGSVALWVSRRRVREKGKGARSYPYGGEMDDLNKLLQEGAISPEEYELIKRRILAGQVY
ncbi:SHOCT domain-containing protein [Noviherbaspirillum sp. CPCC 100848]|uniref:SHOCT domain-containing protein n=1 Tax=Noviherbaspirillum album TaxID=3080276 RepID=A0ABU6JJG9_9BURK|nr:SHOCT domain-containing protein [Noviherbaspirillum sp. CPCC 100848]MEC4723821.1 SHOCT domain-containing protein [Noviherbaspirillum sp. CPCC 100848]